jgi:hypothetical protein
MPQAWVSWTFPGALDLSRGFNCLVPDNVLKIETGTGTGRGVQPEPVSMNRFFKKYIKYLNNDKNIFLRF